MLGPVCIQGTPGAQRKGCWCAILSHCGRALGLGKNCKRNRRPIHCATLRSR
jgi:hypothetical protein